MKRTITYYLLPAALFFLLMTPLSAQDGFGFGDVDDGSGSQDGFGFGDIDDGNGSQDDSGFGFGALDDGPSAPVSVDISGEASAWLIAYPNDFTTWQKLNAATLGDIFSGKLNFAASAANADAVINLNVKPVFDWGAKLFPIGIDEAYVRGYFGNFTIEGGLRKLTWGKADSLGPLDVINPLDYTELTNMTDIMGRKIARPLIHASYNIGSFSKLEAVFVPTFEGIRFAQNGRWAPSQMTKLPNHMAADIVGMFPQTLQSAVQASIVSKFDGIDIKYYPNIKTLEYAQAGVRFTTTIFSADIGFQYYFGRLNRPAIIITGLEPIQNATTDAEFGAIAASLAANPFSPIIDYNRFHQIGVDYAQVLAGFNVRAEFAANITKDLSGDDGSVYNPFLAWSLGFDRDVVGVNVNLQVNENIQLMNNKVNDNIALDTEAGTDVTSTRLTLVLSKKFFRDELEIKTTGVWGIEDKDFLIMPAIIWTKGSVSVELSGGIFSGDSDGELGQYHKNSFVKTGITYSF